MARVVVVVLMVLLVVCGDVWAAPLADEETVDAIETNVMLAEFDYQDKCQELAEAQWKWMAHKRRPLYLGNKTLAEDEFAKVQRLNARYVRSFWQDSQVELPPNLRSRFYLAGHPGDALLDESHYKQVLNFSSNLQRQYSTVRIPCYHNATDGVCQLNLQEVLSVLATSGDVAQLLHVWRQWLQALSPAGQNFQSILQAVQKASAANEAEDVETYWQQLSDLDETYDRIEELWQDVQPLYNKLHAYVSRWLEHNYGHEVVGNISSSSNIPAHLLGSFLGEDWSSLSDLVIPLTDTTMADIEQALHNKVASVRALQINALENLVAMGLPEMDKSKFLSSFLYSGSCPAATVRFCNDGQVKVITCSTMGWSQLLDAYSTSTRILHSHLAAKDQRHVLRESIRYSAMLDAIPGMVSLLAASPHHLSHLGLLSDNAVSDDSQQSQTLRLMVALRTLPRLAFYLAADKWRLQLLKDKGNETTPASWSEYRQKYQRVEAPVSPEGDLSFLTDPYITSNRPYLGKFAALLHQFQLLEYFTEDDVENPVEGIKYKDELEKIMTDGQSQRFPDLAVLTLGTEAILRYFEPLESLLDELVPENAPKVVRKPVIKVSTTDIPQLDEVENEPEEVVEEVSDDVSEEILRDATPLDEVENSTEVISVSANMSDVNEVPSGNISLSQILDTETPVTEKASPGFNTAILFGSLVVFGLALVTGFFVAGRRCYKRKYQRNRRPSAS